MRPPEGGSTDAASVADGETGPVMGRLFDFIDERDGVVPPEISELPLVSVIRTSVPRRKVPVFTPGFQDPNEAAGLR